MKIAVRMDDITPDMDWEKFERFTGLLDEAGIRPLIGVVPDNRDVTLAKNDARPDFWERIRKLQARGYVIAMHGYCHRYTTTEGGMFPLNNFSEFAGLPYERQREMLERGREILIQNGIRTEIFMAPAHSYDGNTLMALKDTGFTAMTDGFGSRPYLWKGIAFYPIAFRLESSRKRRKGFTTMVIHANTIREEEWERCRRIVTSDGMISYEELLAVHPVRRTLPGRLGEFLLAYLKHLLVKALGGG